MNKAEKVLLSLLESILTGSWKVVKSPEKELKGLKGILRIMGRSIKYIPDNKAKPFSWHIYDMDVLGGSKIVVDSKKGKYIFKKEI